MDLILKDIQNEIGEIKTGDILCFTTASNHWYIVMLDNKKEFYCLRDLNGVGFLCNHDEHKTLESLRQSIMSMISTRVVHYPAKEYRLELVKK